MSKFRYFELRLASFRHFAWRFFVISSFCVAFFRYFVISRCVISLFRLFAWRYFVISLFCVALFRGKKTKRRNGTNQPPYVFSERSSNSRSEFASSLYSRKQVTFLYSLQLKFLRKPHHRNFRHFNACVVHIFVLLKMKTVAILFLPTDIHIDKSGMYLRQKQPITFPENCVRRVD